MGSVDANSGAADETRWHTANEYQDAFCRLDESITVVQRRMLVAHAEAPDCMLSVRQLAAAGGYDKPNVTYSQYGRLGHLIASSLGITEPWKVWTHFIGHGFRAESGELIWKMHPALVQALIALGWASRSSIRTSLEDIALASDADDFPTLKTEREILVQARIGQGPFRIALLRYWGACAVSGVSEPAVLRASHIKPWRDATNVERLDPNNGILLAAHIDALFDAGLITFEVAGTIRLSSLLADEDLQQLGVFSSMQLRHITADHEVYMRHHRQFVFRTGDRPTTQSAASTAKRSNICSTGPR